VAFRRPALDSSLTFARAGQSRVGAGVRLRGRAAARSCGNAVVRQRGRVGRRTPSGPYEPSGNETPPSAVKSEAGVPASVGVAYTSITPFGLM
jgi:hypothetical protein